MKTLLLVVLLFSSIASAQTTWKPVNIQCGDITQPIVPGQWEAPNFADCKEDSTSEERPLVCPRMVLRLNGLEYSNEGYTLRIVFTGIPAAAGFVGYSREIGLSNSAGVNVVLQALNISKDGQQLLSARIVRTDSYAEHGFKNAFVCSIATIGN